MKRQIIVIAILQKGINPQKYLMYHELSDHKAVIASMTMGVVRNVKKGRKIYLLSKSDRKQIKEYLRSKREIFVSEDEDVDQKWKKKLKASSNML